MIFYVPSNDRKYRFVEQLLVTKQKSHRKNSLKDDVAEPNGATRNKIVWIQLENANKSKL